MDTDIADGESIQGFATACSNPPVEKHVTLWTPFEKLRECQREKDEGNALFKAGDYAEAIKHV